MEVAELADDGLHQEFYDHVVSPDVEKGIFRNWWGEIYPDYRTEQLLQPTDEEKARWIGRGLHEKRSEWMTPNECCDVRMRRMCERFRQRTGDSLCIRLPFDDYVQHDEHGGKPQRSKIVTGNIVPYAIDSNAKSITGILQRQQQALSVLE